MRQLIKKIFLSHSYSTNLRPYYFRIWLYPLGPSKPDMNDQNLKLNSWQLGRWSGEVSFNSKKWCDVIHLLSGLKLSMCVNEACRECGEKLKKQRNRLHVRACEQIGRVDFPNNYGKNFTSLASFGSQSFYTRLKIFLYLNNPWSLLFRMVWSRPFYIVLGWRYQQSTIEDSIRHY